MKSINMAKELGIGLMKLSDIIDSQELIIEKYRLKTAMYKAFFFHRSDLATNIQQQIMENNDAEIGEFDGFCYASWRANAVYRTLEDMAKQGLITKEEYNFCNERS